MKGTQSFLNYEWSCHHCCVFLPLGSDLICQRACRGNLHTQKQIPSAVSFFFFRRFNCLHNTTCLNRHGISIMNKKHPWESLVVDARYCLNVCLLQYVIGFCSTLQFWLQHNNCYLRLTCTISKANGSGKKLTLCLSQSLIKPSNINLMRSQKGRPKVDTYKKFSRWSCFHRLELIIGLLTNNHPNCFVLPMFCLDMKSNIKRKVF